MLWPGPGHRPSRKSVMDPWPLFPRLHFGPDRLVSVTDLSESDRLGLTDKSVLSETRVRLGQTVRRISTFKSSRIPDLSDGLESDILSKSDRHPGQTDRQRLLQCLLRRTQGPQLPCACAPRVSPSDRLGSISSGVSLGRQRQRKRQRKIKRKRKRKRKRESHRHHSLYHRGPNKALDKLVEIFKLVRSTCTGLSITT
jgi:hypothetical protein